MRNDLWGKSHFNFDVDGRNYQVQSYILEGDMYISNYLWHFALCQKVLRTGAFPFIKFHCSLKAASDLQLEDKFIGVLKILNFGK